MKYRYCSLFWLPFFLLCLLALGVAANLDLAHRALRAELAGERLVLLEKELSQVGGVWEQRLGKSGGLAAVMAAWPAEEKGAPAYSLLDGQDHEFALLGGKWLPVELPAQRGGDFTHLLEQVRVRGEPAAALADSGLLVMRPVAGAMGAVLVREERLPPALLVLDQQHARLLGNLGMLLGAAVLVLFLLVRYFGVRRVLRIDDALRRFAEGDSDSRANLRGADLIARLGQRFDGMVERMAAERRNLAESEERLKFALRGSNAGIWDWHLDSGSTYYSPRWKSLLGYGEDELVAHAEEWLKRVHPDDLPDVMERLKDHMAGKTEFFSSEHRLRRKDGSYLWVLERGWATRDERGVACRMVGALTDISRRKEVESALLRSEEKYRSVVDGVTQVIFRCDAWGRLLFLNPAWCEASGYPVDESLSANLIAYVHDDDKGRVQLLLRHAVAAGNDSQACELRLLRQDGESRWFSLHVRAGRDGEDIILAGVLTDINVQKATEAALTHSNRERNAILALSPDGFVFVDAADMVAYVNPAFLDMTRFRTVDIVGQPVSVLQQKLAALCDPAKPAPDFVAAEDGRDNTMYLQPPDKLVLRWLLRNIPNDLGGLHGRVMFFRDITRESEVDRMKSEFLSTAAHELRTPMASIFGFSELLLAREFDAETQRDLIQTIHRQTQNLINLVNELLDLARIEARGGKTFKMLVQDLNPLLLNALAALYVPPETHSLVIDLPKAMPKVRVDAEKFQQCLANILSNAVKYSPLGGEVRVSLAERQTSSGEEVGVVIEDQGIGMTEEQIGHVFDRFYRADASGVIPGTGLGMSLVKEIMDIFGGQVAISSEMEKGTQVVLWLPVAVPGEEAVA